MGLFLFCQVRDLPLKPTEEGELEEEAEWVYKHAFLDIPISIQQVKMVFPPWVYLPSQFLFTNFYSISIH